MVTPTASQAVKPGMVRRTVEGEFLPPRGSTWHCLRRTRIHGAMGHTFHSEVGAPTVRVLDAAAAKALLDSDASATLVGEGYGAAQPSRAALCPRAESDTPPAPDC